MSVLQRSETLSKVSYFLETNEDCFYIDREDGLIYPDSKLDIVLEERQILENLERRFLEIQSFVTNLTNKDQAISLLKNLLEQNTRAIADWENEIKCHTIADETPEKVISKLLGIPTKQKVNLLSQLHEIQIKCCKVYNDCLIDLLHNLSPIIEDNQPAIPIIDELIKLEVDSHKIVLLKELGIIDHLKTNYKLGSKDLARLLKELTGLNVNTLQRGIDDYQRKTKGDVFTRPAVKAVNRILTELNIKPLDVPK